MNKLILIFASTFFVSCDAIQSVFQSIKLIPQKISFGLLDSSEDSCTVGYTKERCENNEKLPSYIPPGFKRVESKEEYKKRVKLK